MTTTHTMPRLLVGGAILAIVVAACGGGASTAPTAAPTGTAAASAAMSEAPSPTADPMAALVTAAKAEGNLTTIALPRSWCNYGALLDGFTAKYGITINNLNPDGSSQQELDAITANKDTGGPAAPDVVDVGLSYGPKGVTEGLFQPYQVATWKDIPDSAKDATGMWYGDYYGVMAFEINTQVVTSTIADWKDLLNLPKNSVALAGDPTGSNQAVSAVWAAALANGGSLDNAQPGLDSSSS